MIRVHSLAFGSFAEAEPLNPQFADGHRKLRLTVDTESNPDCPDREVLRRLEGAFPGLGRHRCHAPEGAASAAPAAGVLLLESQSSANQAHILEHLLLEILVGLGEEGRLSGVTCVYHSPPERNDIFVECADTRAGVAAVPLAVEILNAALSGGPLVPSCPDAVTCLSVMLRANGRNATAAAWLSRASGIPADRTLAALEALSRIGAVESETYSMNFSGEPFYRLRAAPNGGPALEASVGAGTPALPAVITRSRSSPRSSGRSSTPRGAP